MGFQGRTAWRSSFALPELREVALRILRRPLARVLHELGLDVPATDKSAPVLREEGAPPGETAHAVLLLDSAAYGVPSDDGE